MRRTTTLLVIVHHETDESRPDCCIDTTGEPVPERPGLADTTRTLNEKLSGLERWLQVRAS
jgi:hypothetical protein